MPALTAYVLDRESIKLDAYRLLCLFYANKEIARLSDPMGDYPDPAVHLERAFFAKEVTRLLLAVAIGVRTLDDQMERLPSSDPDRDRYIETRRRVNRTHQCMEFDPMSLREACNKIIHATVVEPHDTDGVEAHAYDQMMWESWQEHHDPDNANPKPFEALPWKHLSGLVRLGGTRGHEEWWVLLNVPLFVEAVYELLSNRVSTTVAEFVSRSRIGQG